MYVATHFAPFFKTPGGASDAACAEYGRHRLSKVKSVTVKKEQAALRRMFAWCEEQGFISSAPRVPRIARKTTGTAFKVRRRGAATRLEPSEVEALLAALPEFSSSKKVPRFVVRARFIVQLETALRPATVSALQVPDNYVRGDAVLRIREAQDKERYARDVPLTPAAREALDSVCPDAGPIFGEHDYRPLLRQAAKKVLPPDRAATFTAYDLRHFRLTTLAELGNLPGAAFLVGHKQVTTINSYAKPNQQAAGRLLGQLEEARIKALAAPETTTAAAPVRRGRLRAQRRTRRQFGERSWGSAGSAAETGRPAHANRAETKLCEGEDLNLHGSYPASTSSQRKLQIYEGFTR